MSADQFQNWKEEYKWENCQLGNKEYGMFLSNYIKSQKQALTLNINGQWGIGKTHFLRQIYTQLRYEEKLPTIYINAWESDFSNDPLLVIFTEILKQIKTFDTKQKLKGHIAYCFDKLNSFYNKSIKTIGAAASITFANSAFYDISKDLQTKKKDTPDDLSSLYLEQQRSFIELKNLLKDVVNATENNQVFVLVDELDRCRPSYAVEFLETIKHIFDIDGLVFVVATDTEQLSHSIKAIYGATFDGSEYLSRFFERSAKLPEPNKTIFSKYLIVQSTIYPSVEKIFLPLRGGQDKVEHLATIFGDIGTYYGLSLRRIKQLFDKYESIVLALEPGVKFDSHFLVQLLCEFSHPRFNFSYEQKKQGTNRVSRETKNQLNLTTVPEGGTIQAAAKLYDIEIRKEKLEFYRPIFQLLFSVNEKGGDFSVNLRREVIDSAHNSRNRDPSVESRLNTLYFHELEKSGGKISFLKFDDYFKYVELAAHIS
ncbi:KAP family NTPase [Pseudoalteromonas sp. L23]|uniref:KAP family P-loop NTPase fold protein n=1 Tax=unclassified Pseudoalteromonas TaxID=194690 RepID=UPI001EEFBE4B|nr:MULTISPECIES: P-loop NTPase fold protein [unclassified Pseudoalteromonas]MCF7512988.1 KAP family NTPase [Pseudoalteromonas sp. L7]MCF7525028.1 KAP family NTPase [Pseudoalteromonas sp. L23]